MSAKNRARKGDLERGPPPEVLKKGGPHEKSRKAERKRDKDQLRKQEKDR